MSFRIHTHWAGRAIALACLGFLVSATATAETADGADAAASAASVEKGKTSYGMFCQACHGPEDTTIDSPSNLFDTKWYNSDGPHGIEKTIREGIAEKGMPAWGQMISDEEISSIIAYLLSFQNPDASKENA